MIRRSEYATTTEYGDYDAFGQPGYRIEAAGTPEAQRTDYLYDPRFRGKPQRVRSASVYPGGERIETFRYDDQGRTLEHTLSGYDPDGQALSRTYRFEYHEPFGQLSLIDGPRTDVDDTTRYEYYPDDTAEGPNRGRLRRIIDANGLVVRDELQYSATGKVLSERRPNDLVIVNTYYPGNYRLASRSETSGGVSRVTRWTYLPSGEPESVTTDAGTAVATTISFVYDAARRLVGIRDALGNRIEFTLDSEGNVLEEQTVAPDGMLGKQLTRRFDAYNRLDTLQQANERLDYDYAPDSTLRRTENAQGVVTTYTYDALLRLVGQVQDVNGIQAWIGYDYDTQNRLIRVTDANANPTDYGYDDLDNLLVLTSPDTGTEVRRYDAAGNLRQRTDAKG